MDRFQLMAVVSLPQEAFQHSGAGVKASIVFVRKRAENEFPKDNEPIFMAAPPNIGYDSTGRKSARVTIKSEAGNRKTEIHSSDLYDLEVTFEKATRSGTELQEWQEKNRRVISNTGILGQYRSFEKRPHSFFV